MHRYQLSIEKTKILRQRFIDGEYHSYLFAKELKISTITTWRYKREFERIRAEFPDRLRDFGSYPGEPKRPHWSTLKYDELALILPVLLTEEKTATIETSSVWNRYRQQSTHTYVYSSFKGIFIKWVKDNVTSIPQKLIEVKTKANRYLKSKRS